MNANRQETLVTTATRAMLLAAVVSAALLGGCKKEVPPAEPPPEEVEVMRIVPLESKDDSFDLHAKVEPNRVVHVAAEVTGRIEEVCCDEGTYVKAGNDGGPIIRLNTDLIQARVDRARAKANIDKLNHERIATLKQRRAATASELDQIAAQAATSKAELKEALATLERTSIYPPIDGILNHRPVEEGDYVQPGQTVAEIVDSATVKIVAHVPERDIHFLEVGDPVRIIYTFKRRPRIRDAKITFISKLSHPRALTTQIEAKVNNSTGEFFSGQIVSLRIRRRVLKDVIMIPMDAVVPLARGDGGWKYAAYVVEGDTARRRDNIVLDMGFIEGKNVRVVSGLAADERLIVEGQRYVGPGQKVKVVAPATRPGGATQRGHTAATGPAAGRKGN